MKRRQNNLFLENVLSGYGFSEKYNLFILLLSFKSNQSKKRSLFQNFFWNKKLTDERKSFSLKQQVIEHSSDWFMVDHTYLN